MSLFNEARAAFSEAESSELLGDSFTIDGDTYTGTFSAEVKESDFSDFSQREKTKRTCAALKAQFAPAPDPNLRPVVVFDGVSYVVTAVNSDQLHYVLTLTTLD